MLFRNHLWCCTIAALVTCLGSSGAVGQTPNATATRTAVSRSYPIADYTSRVNSVAKPEQAIIDWILRETGTDPWFTGSAVASLHADRTQVTVRHTEEMQGIVKEVIDRFSQSAGNTYVIGMRLMTVNSPNWRAAALSMLQPVTVQSPGVDAWLLSKEDAAVLLGQLSKRTDFVKRSDRNFVFQNGQPNAINSRIPRTYLQGIVPSSTRQSIYEYASDQIDEGYSLEISALVSADNQSIDAVIKCDVDQVERFVPVGVNLSSPSGQQTRAQVQVPQLVSWRLHERFRWPANHVLVLSCGVIATPAVERQTGLLSGISGVRSRADALLFLEYKGTSEQTLLDRGDPVASGTVNTRGRY